ncbi:dual specificity protein phosphatase family protein [Halobaculum sp. CBA1158]|uniref:dual specificity protein phosphatase family protein n=1 Tax=Halobaculum sp. CBA1158 TaxID=2904243 RepID=UPI001F3A84E6|nr:dual specificity protein phosphatase [Halobaculum sp. CBA1158]UIO99653.1 dual specificity protein phosphatase family protein [Halobaculum sp. CBA1158]
MDEVFKSIYVGTESDANDESLLRNHGVDVVISLTHSNPETGDIALVDVPMVDGPQNSYQAFAEAVETVVGHRENDRCVLVHCSAGSSRSPSVAAAAIPRLSDTTLDEAFEQILERRPETDPHDALVRQAVKITREGSG